MFLRLTYESFRFAWEALRSNVLRTLLSLLGVTIGIFAIVAVLTIVDSMKKNIKDSLDFLGSNVVYVNKWPWFFGEGEYKWWEYFRRPNIQYKHFKHLEDNLESHSAICAMDFEGGVTLRKRSNSFDALVQGVTFQYNQISELKISNGRYFTATEIESGRNVCMLGYEIANTLFLPNEDPVGQEIKVKGIKFVVIGVMEKKGKSIADVGGDQDTKLIMTYGAFARMFQGGNPNIDVVVKALPDDMGALALESDIIGLMRSKRGLKPSKADDFAVNHPEAASKALDGIFAGLTLGGWVIALFSLLIGGFGIANIMFVSVKERTNIIGIQKSLGAKNYFILFQFLFEAVFLCLVGAAVGIGLSYLVTFLDFDSFDIVMSVKNITIGVTVASVIGVAFGIIPAWSAAKLDPVIAIRAK